MNCTSQCVGNLSWLRGSPCKSLRLQRLRNDIPGESHAGDTPESLFFRILNLESPMCRLLYRQLDVSR